MPSPDGSHVFVSLGRAKSVGVIDVATPALKQTFEDVGARPWGIGISPDGTKLYTANGPSGDVSIVDVATGTRREQDPGAAAPGALPWPSVPECVIAQPASR